MARGDIHGLHGVGRISPMADDVDVGLLVLHPAIDIVSLFGNAHAVHLAAHAQDVTAGLASVGVGVGEINGTIGSPFRVGGIGVADFVADVAVVAHGGGEAERL